MSRKLVTINLSELKNYILDKIAIFPEIQGVYLFGSCLEKLRPNSDIDIGIILDKFLNEDKNIFIEKLYYYLGHFNGHSFDITSIRDTNIIIAFKILNKGLPIYINDQESVSDLIEFISRRYLDIYPRYRKALEMISIGGN